MQIEADEVVDLIYDEKLKSYGADFETVNEIHQIPSLSDILSNESRGLGRESKRMLPIRVEPSFTPNQSFFEEQHLIEARASALNLIMTIVGAVLGFAGASIAWFAGLELIPVLAVYCAIGSATTLGTIVVNALISNGRY